MSTKTLCIGVIAYNQYDVVNADLFESLKMLQQHLGSQLEITVCDDGSSDLTSEKIEAYLKQLHLQYTDMSFIENQGANFAYRRVLNSTNADYFLWLCCDDNIDALNLLKILDLLKQNKDADFAICNSKSISQYSKSKAFFAYHIFSESNHFCLRQVYKFYNLPLSSFKDNLIYSLWKTTSLKRKLEGLDKITGIRPTMVGGAILPWLFYGSNYISSNSTVLEKKYKSFLPSSVISILYHRIKLYSDERHAKTFNVVNSFDVVSKLLQHYVPDISEQKKCLLAIMTNHRLGK